jgi:hypothetical protein
MAVFHDNFMPGNECPKRVTCQQCGMGSSYSPEMKDHLDVAVWWDFGHGPTIALCPPCAEHIGTQLIGDAARACVSMGSGKIGRMRQQQNQAIGERNDRAMQRSREERAANLKHITQRPSHDRESVSSETDLDF